MKKLVAVFMLLLAFAILPGSALGQTASPSPTRTAKGQQIRQEVQQRITEQKEERKAALTQARQEKIRGFFNRMVKRFEAAIARLNKLIERIQVRINKIKEDKPDTNLTDVQTQLDSAKTKLSSAKDKLQSLKDGLEGVLSSTEPKEAFKNVGQSIRDLKSDLVKIHKILVQVIGDIKGLRVGQND